MRVIICRKCKQILARVQQTTNLYCEFDLYQFKVRIERVGTLTKGMPFVVCSCGEATLLGESNVVEQSPESAIV